MTSDTAKAFFNVNTFFFRFVLIVKMKVSIAQAKKFLLIDFVEDFKIHTKTYQRKALPLRSNRKLTSF